MYNQLNKFSWGQRMKVAGFVIVVGIAVFFLGRSNFLVDDNQKLTEKNSQVNSKLTTAAPVVNGIGDLCKRDDKVAVALDNAGLCNAAYFAKTSVPQIRIPVQGMAGQNAFCFNYPNLPQCMPVPGPAGKPGHNAFCYDNPNDKICQPKQGIAGQNGDNGNSGINGMDGRDGRNAFCFDNPSDTSCQAKQGEKGADGTSVISTEPIRNDNGMCEWKVKYSDGREDRYPAGDAACPANTDDTMPSSTVLTR